MKKALLAAVLLLLPSIPRAQETIKVASVYGPVEHKVLRRASFVPLSSSTGLVNVGDEVRTGPGATLTLELPGCAFMILHENSTLTVQEPGLPTLRNFINSLMVKARFYIQRLGGKSTPCGAGTPTAVIAVRS